MEILSINTGIITQLLKEPKHIHMESISIMIYFHVTDTKHTLLIISLPGYSSIGLSLQFCHWTFGQQSLTLILRKTISGYLIFGSFTITLPSIKPICSQSLDGQQRGDSMLDEKFIHNKITVFQSRLKCIDLGTITHSLLFFAASLF